MYSCYAQWFRRLKSQVMNHNITQQIQYEISKYSCCKGIFFYFHHYFNNLEIRPRGEGVNSLSPKILLTTRCIKCALTKLRASLAFSKTRYIVPLNKLSSTIPKAAFAVLHQTVYDTFNSETDFFSLFVFRIH